MQIPNILQKNYTAARSFYQLKLPLNIQAQIPEDDSVRLFSQVIEEMDLSSLYATYSRIEENKPSPRQMLKIVVYAYDNHKFSSREIETLCKRDINFMFLLEGKKAPDHTTISRFRRLHLEPVRQEIFARLVVTLLELGELSGKQVFIDGTKIEAVSNKYTFVWKKAVTKHQTKLFDKLPEFVLKTEEVFGIRQIHGKQMKLHHLKKLRRKLKKLQIDEGITFVEGTGKRKSVLQKTLEELDRYLERLKKYNQQIHQCGTRNSYSKTDHDATFMRMKEDHMRNGQLKPAYNVQAATDAEYIVGIMASEKCTDTPTLIPFLEQLKQNLGYEYEKVVADAGYESEENYVYLEKNGQLAFIKPINYETLKTRKYKNDIGRYENMNYDQEADEFLCAQGKRLIKTGIKREKTATGYKSEKTIYTSEGCAGCPRKAECIRGISKKPLEERTKQLYMAWKFIEERQKSQTRITSKEGIKLRVNRSIQSEGVFGILKEDMGFRRFLCKGRANAETELILLSMAYDLGKLHRKIQNERCGKHLHEIKSA